MLDIENLLVERGVPSALLFNSGEPVKTPSDFEKRREEIKEILEDEEYGKIPKRPDHLRVEEISVTESFCAGKAPHKRLSFVCSFGEDEIAFPVSSVIPKSKVPSPAFVFINFRPDVPDKYLPIEEIVDRGYAVFSFCYTDISADDSNFKSGFAKYLTSPRRKMSDSGKIAMWAWGAMRIMDYIETLDSIDRHNVAVAGQERLGAAALVAGGFDERFKYVISNGSGLGGAALFSEKSSNSLASLLKTNHFWFCPRCRENERRAENQRFDQNLLAALTVPRHLMIGSAEDDVLTSPKSEFLTAASVNSAYALHEKEGIAIPADFPSANTVICGDGALYQVRRGYNYFSRDDWNIYMNYIDKNKD